MAGGFNTEVAHEGTLYHVQTEPRKEAGIETAVYVKGAVIHSLKTSHPELLDSSCEHEQKFQALIEEQHRRVIAQVRAGEIKQPLVPAPAAGRVKRP